jgi:DNA replication and repair protein RecF
LYLKRISILNYRNIAECDLQFSPKINCFLGRNGMGKTNLLDAVYYLSFCKSHLNPIDAQVVKHDAEFFMLQGTFERQGSDEVISCSVKHRAKKRFKRNQKDYERLSDHIGFVPVVLVSPTDADLVNEGSECRRRFMDSTISQYDKPYLEALIRYNAALQNRNALLKAEAEPDAAMLDIYEEQMAAEAEYIFAKRTQFITDFVPIFQEFYGKIAHDGEQVGLTYESHSQRGDLRQLLREVRSRDRILGYTTRGSHKDDLVLTLADFPMKRTGSQGQVKTFVVALKLAQLVLLKRICDLTPILLFDDIFDKLDSDRMQRIIQLVAGDDFGQIFITDTNSGHLDEILAQFGGEQRLFNVVNGTIIENEQ